MSSCEIDFQIACLFLERSKTKTNFFLWKILPREIIQNKSILDVKNICVFLFEKVKTQLCSAKSILLFSSICVYIFGKHQLKYLQISSDDDRVAIRDKKIEELHVVA